MSSALAKLRRHFDDPLLVRDGRGFVLTPLAQSLRAPVTALLIAAREVLTAGRSFDPALDHRTFTIAASDYAAAVLIQPALRGLTADAPNVRINVESLPDDVLDGLRNLRYDLLVWPLQLPLPGLLEFPNTTLFTDEFVAVVDEDNELVEVPLSAEEPGRDARGAGGRTGAGQGGGRGEAGGTGPRPADGGDRGVLRAGTAHGVRH